MDEKTTHRKPESGIDSGTSTMKSQEGDFRTDTTFKALSNISSVVQSAAAEMNESGADVCLAVDNVGSLQGLKPCRIEFDELFDDRNFQVSIAFHLEGASPQVFEFLPTESLGDINRMLRQNDLKVLGSRRLPGDHPENSLLRLELSGSAPASASFQSNPNFAEIIFQFKNLGSAGEQVWYLDPEAITPETLQNLKAFIQLGDQTFLEMPGVHRDPQEETTPVIDLGDDALILAEAYKAEVLCFQTSRKALEKRLELTYWNEPVYADSSCREFRIGRRPPVELKIASRFVSRLHATIIVERNTFTLRDHSSNGTFVQPDGKPVFSLRYSSQVLRGSGVISLGEDVDPENPHLIYYRIV